MLKKNTDDLRQELMSEPNLDQFLEENRENFYNEPIHGTLQQLFQKKGITKSHLAKLSGISEVYLHQVFSGRRNPSRNRLLCLCFGLSATLEETQDLLRRCGQAPLYPKIRRDAILIHSLIHGSNVSEANVKLEQENEEPLI